MIEKLQQLMDSDPRIVALMVTGEEIDREFRAACDRLTTARSAFHTEPTEYNLREFCGALRIAENATARALAFDDMQIAGRRP